MKATTMGIARAATRRGRESRLTRGLLAGALATAFEAIWTHEQVKILGGREPVYTPSLLVHRMVRAATGHSLDRRVASALGVLMRSGYGPLWAAAWVLVGRGREPRLVRDSCVLGGSIWLFEIIALPTMRATPPLRRWPATDIALDLSNGLVFALVTNGVLAMKQSSPRAGTVRAELADVPCCRPLAARPW